MTKDKTFADRLKTACKDRGLTYADLAARSEVSESSIKKIAIGKMNPSQFMIGKLADGLGVDAERLRKGLQPEAALEIVPALQRALASVDLMDDDLELESLDALRSRVVQVGKWRRGTQYRKIVPILPELVDHLLVRGREDGEQAYALLTDVYRAANTLAHKTGNHNLGLTATERMEWAAKLSGDPLRVATVGYLKAATLARIGLTRKALKLLEREMAAIEDLVGKDVTAAAVYSTLHMRAGTIAATVGNTDLTRSHLTEAADLARRFTDGRVVYDTVAGETAVKLYRLAAEVDLGEAGTATDISASINMPKDYPRERQTYGQLDRARLALLKGMPDQAIDELWECRAVAPEHFRNSSAVKVVVESTGEKLWRPTDRYRSLAHSAGLVD
ncbi:helix-turn-helix domain-containing protein [Nocardia sp. NPDC050712]|uniref:helix-turn-helix domain-containing protein n=1 Tax=Nocardia sp. NPDC050712 TaxID=3155518 RepID=UPI0033DE5720